MAVLARVNWLAQQRVDLNHLLAQESFLAFDFRSLLTGLSGTVNPYILRGYEVVGRTGLSVSIIVKKSLVFNPLDGNGSFFAGGDNQDDILVDLPADQENIFVQARFINETRAPINTAFWDSLALTGDDVAGTEFAASTNTQNVMVLQIEANTVGFDEDAIPIMRASTSASAVTEMIDARRMLYRLGTGGPTPNPLNKFPWSNTRAESVAAGTGVADDVDSPFRSRDSTGVRNDKGIGSLKEWMDAVMTRLAEIAGQALWYDNSPTSSAADGLTLNTLFIDTIGHNIQPDAEVSLKWSRVAGDLVLQSNGPASVKWQFNYGGLQWELGGTFVNNVAGGSRAYDDVRFTSPAPVDNGNLYLLLERESPKGSGAAVTWANNSADPNLTEPRAVSGVTGDFVGIAIGDYIRKESEGIQRYYKIVAMSDGTTVNTTADYVADSTIVGLEVDRDIDSGVTLEPLRYWRTKYSNDDIVADLVAGEYAHQHLNFQWLGRRRGTLFYLRNYGVMQEGEEVTLINDAFIGIQGGTGDLMLEHGYGTVYSPSTGYSLRDALSVNIVWSQAGMVVNGSTWVSVAYSPTLERFAAVAGSGAQRAMYSDDGLNWTTVTAGGGHVWSDVIWVPGVDRFVAVATTGSDRVMYSPDGDTWTPVTVPTKQYTSVAYSPSLGRLVAVAQSASDRAIYSDDGGDTWQEASGVPSELWRSVAWSPEVGRFVAVSETGTNRVMYSSDGINWTVATPVQASNWSSVTWSSDVNRFVAVADGDSGTERAMYSDDGLNWTAVAVVSSPWRKVIWVPEISRFVAISDSGADGVMYSSDGTTWTTAMLPGDAEWTGLAWSPDLNMLVGVGGNGTFHGVYAETSLAGNLLTIRRRKRDNTVDTPSDGDNSGAYLTYTLPAPVGLMSPGDTLWVKLNDAASGVLDPGSVAGNTTDDDENTDTITNVWEVRSAADTPLRNYDNRDVYPIARCIEIETPAGLVTGLVFLDGTVIANDGQTVNNRFATTGVTRFFNDNVHLMTRPAQSVLFIDGSDQGRIDDDVNNFFYDKPNQILGVFNYRFGHNIIALDSPADQDWLPNLGPHTLNLGSSASTIRILGDLLVEGATVSHQVQTIQSDDKLVTLGVGNLEDDSGGSGIEVADNTLQVVSAEAEVSEPYLDLSYATPHGYTLGETYGLSSNVTVGGITAGQQAGEYTVVSVGSSPGHMEVTSATTVRVWTRGTATASEVVVMSPPDEQIRTFDTLTWMKVTDSDGDTSDMTSWGWRVKGVDQVVTMTPLLGYGTLPTAFSANMLATRIPFVDSDAAGPGGTDSAINFSDAFTFDVATGVLTLDGLLTLVPQTTPAPVAEGTVYYDDDKKKLVYQDAHGYLDVDHGDASGEITGYVNRTDSEFTFDDGTRTFQIRPDSPATFYDYYIRGTRYRETTTKELILPDVSGIYFIYFDTNQDLQYATVFDISLLTDNAYTAVVYWNADTQEAEFLSEERHGLTMDGQTHAYLHQTQGTKYVSGLTLTPNAALGGDGSSDDQAQVAMTGGHIRDEDIDIHIVDAAAPSALFEQILSPAAEIPVAYRTGPNGIWVKDTATAFPLKAGTDRPQWNEYSSAAISITNPDVGNTDDLFVDTFTVGQTFEVGVDANVTSVAVDIHNNGNVGAVTVVCEIRTTSGGLPTTTVLGTSDPIPLSALPGTFGTPTTFTFSTPVALTPGLYSFNVILTAPPAGPDPRINVASPGTFGGPDEYRVFSSDSGATWNAASTQDLPAFTVNLTSSPQWQTVDSSTDGNYLVYWIFATNDINTPVISIMGQAEYPDLDTARENALYEELEFGTLPFQEFKLLYRVIYRTDSAYTNAIKAAAYHVTDYRKATDPSLSSSYMPSDHGNLSGLGDDDHLQYLLLAGRSSGQTVYGGVTSGANLILRSSQNATKGQVWIDESTPSTSATTGALRVDGGVGVGGSVWSANQVVAGSALRALGDFRIEAVQSVTGSAAIASNVVYVQVDTTSAVADITITLPAADTASLGRVLILKDVGGQLSLLNKRAIIMPSGADTLLVDQPHTAGSPFMWDIDYSAITMRSNGNGRWDVI